MNSFPRYTAEILKYLSGQFPEPSEIMMIEIVENFGNNDQCEAFIGAMEFLRSEGNLTYRYDTFGRQLDSIVILTEKGLAATAAIPVSFKENRN